MSKRVFMTGGTGYLGQLLADRLSRVGYECYLLSRKEHIPLDHKHYVLGNVENKMKMRALMKNIRPDILIHFAWDVSAKDYASSLQNQNWAVWSSNLLQEFLACGGRTVVASGTCMEYHLEEPRPHKEKETFVHGGGTLYGRCKWKTCQDFVKQCDKAAARLLWGRIFYPFGPHEASRKFFSQAIRILASGQEFCCHSPENRIDYIYEDDVANIFLALLENEDAAGIFNIGTGTAISLRECLMKIASDLHAESQLMFEDNVGKTIVADMTKTRRFYHEPFVSVFDGLEKLKGAIIK